MAGSKFTFVTAFLTLTAIADYGICRNLEKSRDNLKEYGDYFEGDIEDYAKELVPAQTNGRVRRAALISPLYHWKNATVPYAFAPSYQRQISMQNRFKEATEYMSSKTCLRFVPRTNEKDFIYVMSGNGCYSQLGRQGGPQPVSLPSGCTEEKGIIVHEIMHALGFVHEQTRPGRNDYVKINWGNISPAVKHNFVEFGSDLVSGFGVGYDYKSVMHYNRFAGSISGKPTIERIGPGSSNTVLGQRNGMSKGDIKKINNMYCKSNKN